MTETTTTTATPEAPAFNPVFGEGLSAAEQAYFESGGEKTDGLAPTETNGAASVAEAQTEGGAATQSAPDAAPTTAATEDEPGAIEISSDGKLRDTKTGRFVPHQAFHAEREKRKGAEGELAQVREKFARADERLAVLNEALRGNVPAATAQQAEQVPDPEKDIFAHNRYLEKQLADLKAQVSTTKQETQAKLASSELRQHYEADVSRFKSEQPAFEAAKAFLTAGRHKELEALGVSDEKQRQQMIDRQEAEIAVGAYRQKQRAPEVIYKLAVARGFTPVAPEVKPSAAAERLDTIAKGQAAAASLTSASGGPSTGLTAESVANMNEAEFDALVRKVGSQAALMKMLNM